MEAREVHKRTAIINDYCEGSVDGDKCGYTVLHSEEAINEINSLLNSKNFYVTPEGKITYSSSNTVVDVVCKTLSW